MIRYDITSDVLITKVSALDSGWLKKAKARTKKFVDAKKYEETSSIWSDVKPAYISLQEQKCIFCERQFENVVLGTIEYDLEHFRPKSGVKAWKGPRGSTDPYPHKTGGDMPAGYYWLAYSLDNYAASCKVCNSPLKSNYFPIAGKRASYRGGANALKNEQQYLCYPIGRHDDDPETLVTFDGTLAIPAAKSGPKRKRAQVIIDFFDLNGREQLHQQRATQLVLLGNSLERIYANAADEIDAEIVKTCVSARSPHAACARAHNALWKSSPSRGKEIYQTCRRLVAGLS